MSTTNDKPETSLDPMSLEAIEAQLKQFEIEERKRLGLPVENAKHWFDAVPREFTRDAARAHDDPRVGPHDGARPVHPGGAAWHRLQGPRDGHAGQRRAPVRARVRQPRPVQPDVLHGRQPREVPRRPARAAA